MSHFYLHLLCQGQSIRDEEGCECADHDAAQLAAVRGARSIMSAEVLEGRLSLDQSIDIHDADGLHLSTVHFRDVLEVAPFSRA